MFELLIKRNYYPLFWVQFLAAFNDNLYKNAMVMLITFKLSETASETGLLITLAAGLFILPFFLFSSLAGQISDHYPKTLLIKKIQLAEVLIMALGAIALLNQDLILLFVTLFLMGSQSAFFGPIKYSILPEVLPEHQLMQGNALFSGSTFVAILLGTIFGGLGVLMDDGLLIMSVVIICVAILGYLFTLLVQQTETADRKLAINWNLISSTVEVVTQSAKHKTAFMAVLAISWFWFIGAILLAQIPALVKYDLHADDNVVVLFLTLFSVGIALGASLISVLSKNQLHIRWHWLILLTMSLSLVLAVWSIAATDFTQTALQIVSRETLLSIGQFITVMPANLSLLFMGLLALTGGMYIVPLYTVLQTYTPIVVRARMVAVNNILNAFLMVISAVLLMIGFALSLTLLQMLMIVALLNLVVVIVLFRKRFIAS